MEGSCKVWHFAIKLVIYLYKFQITVMWNLPDERITPSLSKKPSHFFLSQVNKSSWILHNNIKGRGKVWCTFLVKEYIHTVHLWLHWLNLCLADMTSLNRLLLTKWQAEGVLHTQSQWHGTFLPHNPAEIAICMLVNCMRKTHATTSFTCNLHLCGITLQKNLAGRCGYTWWAPGELNKEFFL